MIFVNSKTYKNLIKAMEEELKAASKYEIYAQKAMEDKMYEVSTLLAEIARHEQEHAKIWMKLLNKGDLTDCGANIIDCATTAEYNANHLYRKFSQDATREGFIKIAKLFDGVSKIEATHNELLKKVSEGMQTVDTSNATAKNMWICQNCGNITVGFNIPEVCPICRAKPAQYKTFSP